MRNWNRFWFCSFLPLRPLPDYLWGIETKHELFSPSPNPNASRLPMRNWNGQAWQTKKLTMYTLPDYLWGIETPTRFSTSSLTKPLPDYLWGIETLLHFWRVGQPLASRLPMRNWNSERVLPLARSRASRLPMRNWNIPTLSSHSVSFGFQTTYEELKHCYSPMIKSTSGASRLPMRNWNRRTSNDWKVGIIASRLPMRNWNARNILRRCRNRPASRLPMRNWNRRILGTEQCRWTLPDYLWGIETVKDSVSICKLNPLPDYLWGIETWHITYSLY